MTTPEAPKPTHYYSVMRSSDQVRIGAYFIHPESARRHAIKTRITEGHELCTIDREDLRTPATAWGNRIHHRDPIATDEVTPRTNCWETVPLNPKCGGNTWTAWHLDHWKCTTCGRIVHKDSWSVAALWPK